MAKVLISIPPDGGPAKIEVDGVCGPSCTDLTKNLERALGSVESDKKLPAFYEAAQQGQHVTA